MPGRHTAAVVAALSLLLTTVLVAATGSPAAAGAAGKAPWVTASSPTSMTLDWPGSSSRYRTFYATSYNGVKGKGAKSKTSKASKVRITGLRPGTMYCFQTARASGAGRSPRYCHSTMRRANSKRQTPVGVATFNVCGGAKGCGSWSRREDTVVKRILEAKADVVNIQEGNYRIIRLSGKLAKHGFVRAVSSGPEAVLYQTRTMEPALVWTTARECRYEFVFPTEDTSSWDPAEGGHYDADDILWEYDADSGRWRREVRTCSRVPVQEPHVGHHTYGRHATGAWAHLRVKRTGKSYFFVSAHLSSGKSAKNARARGKQARRLVKLAKATAGRVPIVFAGDFNSHRNRADDAPRIELAKAGYHDTYDRSARYSKNYVNSYNGYKNKPVRGVKYGDHVDRVFVSSRTGADRWAVVAPLRSGRNVRPIASDHHPVRVTVLLP